ncbi:MAG TPA: CHASE3 domain-containing protein, partial [Candidatus Baltobacteraceae bacterium]|nr:CHASE3 domain-containing protein [Candidatus Baltobacteraceae bacterium]
MHVSQLWRWKKERRDQFDLPRWLPITGALLLLLAVAIVAASVLSELKKATTWRKHTIEVILAAQSFQNNILDAQRAMRDFVTTGRTNALESFQSAEESTQQKLAQLTDMTGDNPLQQQRLKTLAAAMLNFFSYDEQMISVYKKQGADAVVKADPGGIEGRNLFGSVHDISQVFSDTETKLLDLRDTKAQDDYWNAERSLIIGCVIAALFLILANLIANRELAYRHRAESQLNQALGLQKAILNSADYGIVTTNPEGIVQTFNPASERLLGYRAEEIIGKATPMLWRDQQEIAERAQKLSAKLGMPVRPSFDAIAKKVQFDEIDEGEWTFIRKDGKRFIASLVVTQLCDHTGNFTGYIGIFRDISTRKNIEAEREKLIFELKDAIAQVKTLSGLIPICGWCKKVRNDKGYWSTVEQYVKLHTDADFTHGMC